MNNNDKLVRLRYALALRDEELAEIFSLGGVTLTKEEVRSLQNRLTNKNALIAGEYPANEYETKCDNATFESFLNGLITFKRGKRPLKPGEVEKPEPKTLTHQNANNVMLKKLKIALSLTSDEMIAILDEAGVSISNSELSALLRKEGHRNYQMCGDRFARNFIKGLGLRYR